MCVYVRLKQRRKEGRKMLLGCALLLVEMTVEQNFVSREHIERNEDNLLLFVDGESLPSVSQCFPLCLPTLSGVYKKAIVFYITILV